MKKIISIFAAMAMTISLFAACAPKETTKVDSSASTSQSTSAQTAGFSKDASLSILGEGVDIKLSSEDMMKREQKELTCNNIDSAGKVTKVTVKGFSLKELLNEKNIDFSKIVSANFIAADGYVMAAPSEEFKDSDIYVLSVYDGEALTAPRSCIPDKRAMYWVKDLTNIELTMGDGTASEKAETNVDTISIFRENTADTETAKLNNHGFTVESYSIKDYFTKQFGSLTTEPVKMIAKDGFTKTETSEIFGSNYVTLTAEEGEEADLPLYFSETISDGMRVKQLDAVIAGTNSVYFGDEITVPQLFEMVNMAKADSYLFIASDGFETEVPAAAIEFGKIFKDDEKGYIRASFEGYDWGTTKGGGKVKYLATIKAKGAAQTTETTAEKSDETAVTPLLKCFVGDKKVTLTEEQFLALPQIEKKLKRTNSKGETVEGTYKGVHWKDLAKAIGADENSTVTFVASDKYESSATPDMLNDPDSLFALYQDGEYIKSDGDGRVWFCVSENFTANYWAKYLVKIVIE